MLSPIADPIVGGSGQKGSVWSRFASLVEHEPPFADLTISLLAQGGTAVGDWAPGGKCFTSIEPQILSAAALDLPVTHVLYHQGERDTWLKTETADYFERFSALHGFLISSLPSAPIVVCTASYRMGETSDAVRAAQSEICARLPGIHRGPDTDLYGSELRYDDTHLSDQGTSRFASELVETFGRL